MSAPFVLIRLSAVEAAALLSMAHRGATGISYGVTEWSRYKRAREKLSRELALVVADAARAAVRKAREP